MPVPVVKDMPTVKSFADAAVDVALKRGVWVDVTAADKTTGRPVPGSVSYLVLPEKPSPERPFEQPFADEYNNFMTIRNDGTFRFVAVPRRAILAFRTDWNSTPLPARRRRCPSSRSGFLRRIFRRSPRSIRSSSEGPVQVKFVLDAGRASRRNSSIRRANRF